MKKHLFLNFLAALLLVMMIAPAAFALEVSNIASGTCGEGITWSLDGYTLTISGSGEMEDGAPWAEHADHIEHVVLSGGITKVGKEAFYKFDRIETVDFGDALVEIGERAFYGCEDIDYIHLPDTFRTFGAGAFRDCTSLKYVYCDGGMPRFNDSCLWTGNYISVFYPGNNPWPADAVNTLVHNFGGRLGIMMGSFEDSTLIEDLETRETEAEEEAETTEAAETTVPETQETTVPTTEATEPVVVMATEPETVPTTEETTVATETTVPETEAATVPATGAEETSLTLDFEGEPEIQSIEEQVESNSWIGIVLIAGVLTFLVIGALTFRILSRKNRRRGGRKGGRYRR